MTTLSPLAAYRLLAREYDSAPNPLLALERRTVPRLLPELRRRVVLDAAAGTGYWARYAAQGGARAIAADYCPEMLAQAPQPAVLADLTQLPLAGECADVVICAFGLGYAPGCLAELARVTRRGGTVIASDIHPDAIGRGWTRSFRVDAGLIQVRHERYSLTDLTARGLERTALLEPALGEPERSLFERAGKAAEFENAARYPAIFVARWTRL